MGSAVLGQKEAASAGALALRNLCDSCGEQLASCLDSLLQLYRQMQSAGAAGHSQGLTLSEDDIQQVLVIHNASSQYLGQNCHHDDIIAFNGKSLIHCYATYMHGAAQEDGTSAAQ